MNFVASKDHIISRPLSPAALRDYDNIVSCPLSPAALRDHDTVSRLTVYYHGGCPDGITGAWALYEALPQDIRGRLTDLGGIFAEGRTVVDPHDQLLAGIGPVFHGLAHSDAAPARELVEDRHVIYVDIVPPSTVVAAVAAVARTLTILDHHRSAKAAIETVEKILLLRGRTCTCVYTEELSGAQIAWDWAHGGVRPQVVDYVGDRDLYTFRLPNSRAVNKALYVDGVTRGFGPLSAFHRRGGISAEMILSGAAYLKYEDQVVARLTTHARPAVVAALLPGEAEPREYCVRAVNTPILQSEVGEAIMQRADPEVHFAVMWAYIHDRGEIWVSLRTNRPDIDLSVIAAHAVGAKTINGQAGGGHPQAAGFTVAGDSIGAAVRSPH